MSGRICTFFFLVFLMAFCYALCSVYFSLFCCFFFFFKALKELLSSIDLHMQVRICPFFFLFSVFRAS